MTAPELSDPDDNVSISARDEDPVPDEQPALSTDDAAQRDDLTVLPGNS